MNSTNDFPPALYFAIIMPSVICLFILYIFFCSCCLLTISFCYNYCDIKEIGNKIGGLLCIDFHMFDCFLYIIYCFCCCYLTDCCDKIENTSQNIKNRIGELCNNCNYFSDTIKEEIEEKKEEKQKREKEEMDKKVLKFHQSELAIKKIEEFEKK